MLENELPIELDCFLITCGLLERVHAAGYVKHTPVKIQEKAIPPKVGWKPMFDGDEPPF